VGSLLLGLFDDDGTLHHVGVASSFTAARRKELVAELAPLREHALDRHPWRDWAQAVFVDFNQNAPHKTVFGAWCVRPRVGAQVSTPIDWDELATVEPDTLTIATVPARVAQRGDPWAGINQRPQSLEPLLEVSRHDLANGLTDAPWPPVYPKQPNEPPRVAPSRARRN
jgi:hypothetical protein